MLTSANSQEKSESGKAASLSIANVGGIFVVLLAGLGVACITACVEYLWTGRQANRDRKVGHADMQAMLEFSPHPNRIEC